MSVWEDVKRAVNKITTEFLHPLRVQRRRDDDEVRPVWQIAVTATRDSESTYSTLVREMPQTRTNRLLKLPGNLPWRLWKSKYWGYVAMNPTTCMVLPTPTSSMSNVGWPFSALWVSWAMPTI